MNLAIYSHWHISTVVTLLVLGVHCARHASLRRRYIHNKIIGVDRKSIIALMFNQILCEKIFKI